MTKRCLNCAGSGSVLGGGMMIAECRTCKGEGLLDEEEEKPVPVVDRRSKSYKEAIDKIMKLDKKLTRDEAIAIFDKEYDKCG